MRDRNVTIVHSVHHRLSNFHSSTSIHRSHPQIDISLGFSFSFSISCSYRSHDKFTIKSIVSPWQSSIFACLQWRKLIRTWRWGKRRGRKKKRCKERGRKRKGRKGSGRKGKGLKGSGRNVTKKRRNITRMKLKARAGRRLAPKTRRNADTERWRGIQLCYETGCSLRSLMNSEFWHIRCLLT